MRRDSADNNGNVNPKFPTHLVDYNPVLTSINVVEREGARVIDGVKLSVRALETVDLIATVGVVTPLVIGQWRGTWMLSEYYGIPWWVSFLVGSVMHLVFALLKDLLQDFFSKQREECLLQSPLVFFVVSRLYTWVFGIACISYWRGLWIVMDEYSGRHIGPVLAVTLVSLALLSMMKTLRTINASPFSVSLDGLEPGFSFPTMFRTSGSRETSLYVLDCLFSVLIVGTLVVFVWRGAWTVLDLYLYPSHADWSAWASLALGYAIVVLTFSLQTPLKGLCGRLEGFWRVCVVDVYLFFSFCGTVNVWRGIWMLLNIYFLPGNPAASYWITHAGCLLILVLINCSNSILVRGVYIDAEEEGGKCAVFPCYYLRLFFQNKRKEKLQQLQIQQQQQQKAPLVATSAKRKSDGDKHLPGSVVLDIQPNSANHVQAPLMGIPLETLQDIPESLL
ncbi:uncharacterized protein fusl isoform X1 [Periplaneta americana]|uniref:uncharacterized protein fusl isoform X1 n=1 Tax=Periplaneta americana TaxID=6978 RepID=UPI0037E99F47